MMGQYPALILTSILTLAVILVNGWTDAPNAIATCVSTRAMRPRPAIIMAAIFNFLGVLVMTLINKKVAETIYNMVDFGGDAHEALVALCAAMVAIVTWATAAWKFGIPTSESHALIAGLSGAAIALHNGLSGINGAEWLKVIYGLALSTLLGFVLGFIVAKLVAFLFRYADRQKANKGFRCGADRRRSGHGFHARRAGWSEVHRRVPARHGALQRPGGDGRGGDTHLADGAVRHRHGPWARPSAACASSSPWAWIWSSSTCIRAFPRILPRRAACCSPR